MIDWYWLPWDKILLVYYEYLIEKVIRFSICDWETKENIIKDLDILKFSFRYKLKSCTIDWSNSIIWAIKYVYSDVVIQRCLVHIQRQVINYISKNPKLKESRELKRIVIYDILSDSFLFPLLFKIWKVSNSYFLNEKTYKLDWKYTFKHDKIRKAVKHIENALPLMFRFDEFPNLRIDKTTNKLEWYFWVLDYRCILTHKWLREDRLHSLIALWIYYKNEKT